MPIVQGYFSFNSNYHMSITCWRLLEVDAVVPIRACVKSKCQQLCETQDNCSYLFLLFSKSQ